MIGLAPITEDVIRQAVDILVREAHPTRVIVFGSHARGDAGPDSDIDFLVILPEVASKRLESARLLKALHPLHIFADILVASEGFVNSSWAGFPGSYLYDALQEGKIMYAVDGTSAPALAKSTR